MNIFNRNLPKKFKAKYKFHIMNNESNAIIYSGYTSNIMQNLQNYGNNPVMCHFRSM